jgi:hypothetical protein
MSDGFTTFNCLTLPLELSQVLATELRIPWLDFLPLHFQFSFLFPLFAALFDFLRLTFCALVIDFHSVWVAVFISLIVYVVNVNALNHLD